MHKAVLVLVASFLLITTSTACSSSPVKKAYKECVRRVSMAMGISKSAAKPMCQRIYDDCKDSSSKECQQLIKPYL